ncbi:unnamed protein product [Prunus brigantina]
MLKGTKIPLSKESIHLQMLDRKRVKHGKICMYVNSFTCLCGGVLSHRCSHQAKL